MQIRTTLCLMLVSAGCVGVIEDASSFPGRAPEAGSGAPGSASGPQSTQVAPGSATSGASMTGTPGTPGTPGWRGAVAGAFAPASAGTLPAGNAAQQPGAGGHAPGGAVVPTGNASGWDPTAVNANGESVGTGDLSQPARGPAPQYADKVPGAKFVLLKNWDFGSNGTIAQMSDLIEEFEFHDQFGTIANGTNYGAVTVAPNTSTAVMASGLGLPNNRQPIEDPSRPYREFTPDAIRTYVRTLSPTATSVTASRHDAGNGSFMAKWHLPKGGSRLKQDVLWESRVRIPKPARGFWFSLWTAGQQWNQGAEMDVVESFGTPNIGPGAHAFHVNSVGGRDKNPFNSWPSELTSLGVTMADRNLSDWHVFTWVYLRDDTYQVYYDGYLVQQGALLWTLSGAPYGEDLDMSFLFDFSWGHTQVSDVNISLPASELPLTYELDYSRVYVRQ